MPPNETFADLLRQAGIGRPAWEGAQGQRPPRPLPRQMRPPAQRANDPRLAQSERDRALRQFDRSNAANVDTYQRQAFDQRNQVAEAANMAAESTGLPAIRRAGSDLTRWGAYTAGTEQGNDDLASGALNLGAGSLGVLGTAGMVPRAPMRGALRPPVTAPEMVAPPRTARPPAQAPDAGGGRGGNAYLDDLRAQGFDVETPLYHGSMNDIDGELLPSESGMLAGGVYLTPNRARASKYTERYSDGSRDPSQRGRVYDVAVRGEIVNVADHSNMTPMEVLTSAQERGASGVRWGDTIVIWNKDNVRRLPAAPDVGNAGGGLRAYHGSPFEFDRFDGAAIGTGEGSQSYGRGLYFAEHPDVAAHYQRTVTRDGMSSGNLYEAELPTGPYLDWDAPIASQPPEVRAAVERLAAKYRMEVPESMMGEDFKSALFTAIRERRNATGADIDLHARTSDEMRDAGLAGIRYLDQGSRGRVGGQPTANFVLFDPGRAQVRARNGRAINAPARSNAGPQK